MSDEEYGYWERHIRLMEFTYNTTVQNTVGAAPFTIAHGIPAHTIVGSTTEDDLNHDPTKIVTEEVSLIKQSATAFANTAARLREQAQRETARKLAQGGRRITFRVNDRVSFYLPPTAREAQRRGRKAKHLQWYRGPATVVKILSPTTYELEYKGARYKRSVEELRPHRGSGDPESRRLASMTT